MGILQPLALICDTGDNITAVRCLVHSVSRFDGLYFTLDIPSDVFLFVCKTSDFKGIGG